jgi:hypothetical protein
VSQTVDREPHTASQFVFKNDLNISNLLRGKHVLNTCTSQSIFVFGSGTSENYLSRLWC